MTSSVQASEGACVTDKIHRVGNGRKESHHGRSGVASGMPSGFNRPGLYQGCRVVGLEHVDETLIVAETLHPYLGTPQFS